MGARWRGRMTGIGLVIVMSLAVSCTSPTLPLPPPTAPLIAPSTDGQTFKLTSIQGAEPNALIVIVNQNETLAADQRVSGTIADAKGSWDATVKAKVGDVLAISQQSGSSESSSTTVTVP